MADDSNQQQVALGNDPAPRIEAGCLAPWEVGDLPEPPRLRWNPRALIGPGLLMAGAAIGAGEWLTGPAMTAKYGGTLMWIASISIFMQIIYNLEVMRYAVYCGEPISVGFFRLAPGPRFWTFAYLILDFGAIWPYLSANAAVPIATAILGHLPAALPTEYQSVDEVVARTGLPVAVVEELNRDMARDPGKPFADGGRRFGSLDTVRKETGLSEAELQQMAQEPEAYLGADHKLPYPGAISEILQSELVWKQRIGYVVFLLAFVPLIFGGKIYNALEKVMVAKIILVLGYLSFVGFLYVDGTAWAEIFLGFVGLQPTGSGGVHVQFFPVLSQGERLDFALLATFAAIAGAGGLSNTQFSNYVREKGWGMGSKVGAIASAVGGGNIELAHQGMVFPLTKDSQRRWTGWMKVIRRDQFVIWGIGCVLGMAVPCLASIQFVRGTEVKGDQLAALTAQRITDTTGVGLYWYLTLLCGFLVLTPSQVSSMDGIIRRWTDVMWTGLPVLRRLGGDKVKFVYYSLLTAYGLWGMIVLVLIPNPLTMVKIAGVLFNFALGFSALHALFVNTLLLPRELRPSPLTRGLLFLCFLFFTGVSTPAVMEFLRNPAEHGTINDLIPYFAPIYLAVGVAGGIGYVYALLRQRASRGAMAPEV